MLRLHNNKRLHSKTVWCNTFWKCNFPHDPSFSFDRAGCLDFLKGWKVALPCSNLSTCFTCLMEVGPNFIFAWTHFVCMQTWSCWSTRHIGGCSTDCSGCPAGWSLAVSRTRWKAGQTKITHKTGFTLTPTPRKRPFFWNKKKILS